MLLQTGRAGRRPMRSDFLQSLCRASVLVGAPKANTSQPDIVEGGAVYYCPWPAERSAQCKQIPFDTTSKWCYFVIWSLVKNQSHSPWQHCFCPPNVNLNVWMHLVTSVSLLFPTRGSGCLGPEESYNLRGKGAHSFNPTWLAEAGWSLWVQGRPELQLYLHRRESGCFPSADLEKTLALAYLPFSSSQIRRWDLSCRL